MLLSDVWSDLRETAYVIRKGGKSSIPVHYYCHSQENPCQTPYPYTWPYWQRITIVSMPIQSQVLTASHNKQKTVSWRNQNTVFSWFWGSVVSDIFAVSWMCNLTTTLTSIFVRTGAAKPGAVTVTNLLTYSPIEAVTLAAASINAAMFPWNVASSTLIENEVFFLSYSLIKVNSTSADIQKWIWGGGGPRVH